MYWMPCNEQKSGWYDYHSSLITLTQKIQWRGTALQRRHNEHDGISNHQPHDCSLNRLFKAQIKETSKLCVTGLCEGNSQVTREFPAQRASNKENVSIRWRRYGKNKKFLSLWPFKEINTILSYICIYCLHNHIYVSNGQWSKLENYT